MTKSILKKNMEDYIFGAVVLMVLLKILKQLNNGNDQDIVGPDKRDHGIDTGYGGVPWV